MHFQILNGQNTEDIRPCPTIPITCGKIVEEGTFDTICNAQGEFSRLWEKYLAEDNKNHNQGF